MTLGAGIAILGVWMLPIAAFYARNITSVGAAVSIIVAIGVTIGILHYG